MKITVKLRQAQNKVDLAGMRTEDLPGWIIMDLMDHKPGEETNVNNMYDVREGGKGMTVHALASARKTYDIKVFRFFKMQGDRIPISW